MNNTFATMIRSALSTKVLVGANLKASWISFALITLILAGCENDQKDIDAFTKDKVIVEEARDIETFYSQDGRIKARLTAPTMLRVVDSFFIEFPHSLHVDFFDDSVHTETWMVSKYGKYMESLHKVFLRDSVVVINRQGDTLRTSVLWWDQDARRFYTDSPATYYGVNRRIYGARGLVATQDLTSIIFNQTTGTVKVPEGSAP